MQRDHFCLNNSTLMPVTIQRKAAAVIHGFDRLLAFSNTQLTVAHKILHRCPIGQTPNVSYILDLFLVHALLS